VISLGRRVKVPTGSLLSLGWVTFCQHERKGKGYNENGPTRREKKKPRSKTRKAYRRCASAQGGRERGEGRRVEKTAALGREAGH